MTNINSDEVVCMYKFETIDQGVSSYISLSLSDKDELDQIAVGMMSNNKIEGLLPMSKQWINQKWVLQYQVSNLMPLNIRIQNLVDEKRFTVFLKGFCDAVLGCGEYLLNADNLILDEKYVFIDASSGEPKLIYLPLMDVEKQDSPQMFINKVIHQLIHSLSAESRLKPILYEYTFEENFDIRRFRESLDDLKSDVERINAEAINGKRSNISEGPAYAGSSYAEPRAFTSGINPMQGVSEPAVPFNINEAPASEENGTQKKKFGLFGGGSKEQKEKKEKKDKKEKKASSKNLGMAVPGMAVPGMESPFNSASEEPLVQSSIQTSRPESPISSYSPFGAVDVIEGNAGHTVILQQEVDTYEPAKVNEKAVVDEDVTQIGEDFAVATNPYFELTESAIPGASTRIDINMSLEKLLIGRVSSDEAIPDIAFPREFKKIGRKHAVLLNKGGNLYLMDLGSANHTFINGQMLSPNQEYVLNDGDEISFTLSDPVKYRVHL